MNTQDLLENSVADTENFLDTNPDLLGITVFTMSQESTHKDDLIAILNRKEVWRISASIDDEGNNAVEKTLIFNLRTLQDIQAIEVYDSFALILWEDESVVIANRPEEIGGTATYNNFIPEIDDTRRGTLHYDDAPIQYYNIVEDSSQNYQYIMNVITKDSEDLQYVSQEGIYYDSADEMILFENLRQPVLAAEGEAEDITAIDSNSLITVVGYGNYNDGKGRIIIFDTQTLDVRHLVEGSDGKNGVGRSVQIQ